jgi:hypothetical protein
MFFKRKMPDVAIRRVRASTPTDASVVFDESLVRSFVREGRRWAEFRGDLLLLRECGEVVGGGDPGDPGYAFSWDFI